MRAGLNRLRTMPDPLEITGPQQSSQGLASSEAAGYRLSVLPNGPSAHQVARVLFHALGTGFTSHHPRCEIYRSTESVRASPHLCSTRSMF